jgi:hypothetical protein
LPVFFFFFFFLERWVRLGLAEAGARKVEADEELLSSEDEEEEEDDDDDGSDDPLTPVGKHQRRAADLSGKYFFTFHPRSRVAPPRDSWRIARFPWESTKPIHSRGAYLTLP